MPMSKDMQEVQDLIQVQVQEVEEEFIIVSPMEEGEEDTEEKEGVEEVEAEEVLFMVLSLNLLIWVLEEVEYLMPAAARAVVREEQAEEQ